VTGLTLPPEDLSANIQTLSAKWGMDITEEQAMSYLMYPKVFSDFMVRQQSKGGDILRHLPTPVYLYGMVPGQKFTMSVPSKSVMEEGTEGVQPRLLPAGSGPVENGTAEFSQVTVKLERITPLKSGHRDLIFTVNGQTQVATVRDTSGVFVFDGPMAAAGDAKQLGSPMPG
jgi:pyruvate carboxylase